VSVSVLVFITVPINVPLVIVPKVPPAAESVPAKVASPSSPSRVIVSFPSESIVTIPLGVIITPGPPIT